MQEAAIRCNGCLKLGALSTSPPFGPSTACTSLGLSLPHTSLARLLHPTGRQMGKTGPRPARVQPEFWDGEREVMRTRHVGT